MEGRGEGRRVYYDLGQPKSKDIARHADDSVMQLVNTPILCISGRHIVGDFL